MYEEQDALEEMLRDADRENRYADFSWSVNFSSSKSMRSPT